MIFTGPPGRIQLRRTKGFRLQAASIALNGRSAVNCARPGWAGNPFHLCEDGSPTDPARAAWLFSVQVKKDGWFVNTAGRVIRLPEIRAKLRGRNLACFCKANSPHCHIITLLEVANGD